MDEKNSSHVLDALSDRRELVNHNLTAHIKSINPKSLHQASNHLFLAGGKRLRPIVCLIAAEAICNMESSSFPYEGVLDLEGSPVNMLDAASSLELIHIFTLIHDDIMDDDDLRRGVPSVHKKFSTNGAILAGDVLHSKAFETLGNSAKPSSNLSSALASLAHVCSGICEGQALDVQFGNMDLVPIEEYLKMIELKTGVLFAVSSSLPAQILGQPKEVVDSLYSFGLLAGKAFQIYDDLLDLTTPSSILGKQRGSDIAEQKQTILTIHASNAGVDLAPFLKNGESIPNELNMDELVQILEDSGTISYAYELSQDLCTQAKRQLEILPHSPSRELLSDIVDFFCQRDH